MSLGDIQKIECLNTVYQLGCQTTSYLLNDEKIIETAPPISKDKPFQQSNNVKILAQGEKSDDYTLVSLEDGSYSFLDRKENLVPQRYDVASAFLEGFAIVGNSGSVTVIDTCFQHLDQNGYFVYCGIDAPAIQCVGFSICERLLKSRDGLIKLTNKKGQSMFFNPVTKKIQVFTHYQARKEPKILIKEEFLADFDESGIAETKSGTIFLESGYYFTPEELKDLSIGSGSEKKLLSLVPKPISALNYIK